MKVYECDKSSWDYNESFGLFASKESAIKCMHKEAKKHNKRKSSPVIWNGDYYTGEIYTIGVYEREVKL